MLNAKRASGILKPRFGSCNTPICKACLMAAIGLTFAFSSAGFGFASNWSGVDDAVVGKYADQYGHPARSPFVDIEKGDLPLFIFTVAGTVGGFIGGYYWRKFFTEKGNSVPGKGSGVE